MKKISNRKSEMILIPSTSSEKYDFYDFACMYDKNTNTHGQKIYRTSL